MARYSDRLVSLEQLEGRRLLASANSLFAYDFDTSAAWTGAAGGSFSTNASSASGTPTVAAGYGTLNSPVPTAAASKGLKFGITVADYNPWKGVLDSGLLPVTNNATLPNYNELTLRFDLKASQNRPIQVYINSYSDDPVPVKTGARQATIYPSARNTYEHFEIDLASTINSGTGTFDPKAKYMSLAFEMNSTRGWNGQSPTVYLDNVNLAKPSYYVSATAPANGDGKTLATAFNTPAQASAVATTGDIVLIGNGTYETKTDPADHTKLLPGYTKFKISTHGKPDQWITFKNEPGESPVIKSDWFDAIFIGDVAAGDAQSTIVATSYVSIRGLHVIGDNATLGSDPAPYEGTRDVLSNGNGITINGRDMVNKPHDILISDCEVENFPGAGISSLEGDRTAFKNNDVHNTSYYSTYGTSGLNVFSSFSYNPSDTGYTRLVVGNRSYGNISKVKCLFDGVRTPDYTDGNGIIIDINNGTAGFGTSPAMGRTLVEDNVSYKNGGSGINSVAANHVDIVNNTCYLNSASPYLTYAEIKFYNGTDSNVVNNIMVARTGAGEHDSDDFKKNAPADYATTTTIKWANNFYAGGDNAVPEFLGTNSVVDNTTASPSSYFVDAENANPDVANFGLKPGTLPINRGTNSYTGGSVPVYAAGSTFDDLFRTFGVIDIGAYEYQA